MHFAEKHYRIIITVFSLLFVLQMWLCSGNLAPYAATLAKPNIASEDGNHTFIGHDSILKKFDCYYIVNYDHMHYVATLNMLRGLPEEHWNWAILLRRPLIHMLGYPLMREFGFLQGGFMIALLFNLGAYIGFSIWVRRRWGTTASVLSLLLLGAYPATFYWGGLPYPHSLITPCMLLLTVLLYKTAETTNIRKIAWYALLTGISYLAYDTYIFFGPAFILLMLWQKKWKALGISVVLMSLPLLLWLWFLHGRTVEASTQNSVIYGNIIRAYLDLTPSVVWSNLSSLAAIFYNTFSAATYVYIGAFTLLAIIVALFTKNYPEPRAAYLCLLFSTLFLFLFLNMAPEYDGWQLRGGWIARIFQPAVVLCIIPVFSLIRKLQMQRRRILTYSVCGMALLVFLLNVRINIAPAFGDYSQGYHHYRFYNHSDNNGLEDNMTKYGRRPLWVCP